MMKFVFQQVFSPSLVSFLLFISINLFTDPVFLFSFLVSFICFVFPLPLWYSLQIQFTYTYFLIPTLVLPKRATSNSDPFVTTRHIQFYNIGKSISCFLHFPPKIFYYPKVVLPWKLSFPKLSRGLFYS